jgi:hypothetical protein
VHSDFVTKAVVGWQVGIATVDVSSPEALADWAPPPGSFDSSEQGYDMTLPAEAHIVAAEFVGAGGCRVAEVAASTLVA